MVQKKIKYKRQVFNFFLFSVQNSVVCQNIFNNAKHVFHKIKIEIKYNIYTKYY